MTSPQASVDEALPTQTKTWDDLLGIRGDRKGRGDKAGLEDPTENVDLTSVNQLLAFVRRNPDPRTGCLLVFGGWMSQEHGVGHNPNQSRSQFIADAQTDKEDSESSFHRSGTTLVSGAPVSVLLHPPHDDSDKERLQLNGQGGTYHGFCHQCWESKPVVANVFWGERSHPPQRGSGCDSGHDPGLESVGERLPTAQAEGPGILNPPMSSQTNNVIRPSSHAQTEIATLATSAIPTPVCRSCFNHYRATSLSIPKPPPQAPMQIPERSCADPSCDSDESRDSKPKINELWFRLEDKILNSKKPPTIACQLGIVHETPEWKSLRARICGHEQLDSLCWEEKGEESQHCQGCLAFSGDDTRFSHTCGQRVGRGPCGRWVTTWRRTWCPFTKFAPLCKMHATCLDDDDDDVDDEVRFQLGRDPTCRSCRSEDEEVSPLSGYLCRGCFQDSPMQSFMRCGKFPLASLVEEGSMAYPPWILRRAELYLNESLPAGSQ